MSAEIPLVVTPTEVRAALEGRLRQIWRPVVPARSGQRVCGVRRPCAKGDAFTSVGPDGAIGDGRWCFVCTDGWKRAIRCPLGRPGDVLWGRETWATLSERAMRDHNTNVLRYRADYATGTAAPTASGGWRPSTQMPRWASRIQLLRVGEARVVRVQEIGPTDLAAVGAPREHMRDLITMIDKDREWFRADWDRRFAKRGLGWGANPWAWAAGVEGVSE